MKNMKKVLFLLLFLLVLGAVNVSAQVRIGGDGEPNEAAVLDLNEDDTNTGTKGLALPRVSLTDATIALPGTPAVKGMLVYNTNTSTSNGLSGIGIYYWDGNRWVVLQTQGIWSGHFACTVCLSLSNGSYQIIPWATVGAPPWASSEACWVTQLNQTSNYRVQTRTAGVMFLKDGNTTTAPEVQLFCWGQ